LNDFSNILAPEKYICRSWSKIQRRQGDISVAKSSGKKLFRHIFLRYIHHISHQRKNLLIFLMVSLVTFSLKHLTSFTLYRP